MTIADHYAVLGVPPTASTAEIAAAYRRALEKARELLDAGTPAPAEHIDALRAAYATLKDPSARRAHDESCAGAPPDSSSAATSAANAEPRVYPFSFAGDGGEYFRIWIVNLLLSVLTLGIYSAWAKVRRERYFHRNLMLDNSGFDYHGEPRAILKGRAIAVLLLVALSVAENFGPLAYGLAMLALVPVVPWLIVRAMRFRAHNASYRGLRFSFHGDYRGALIAFVGYGLLAMITFGLLFPQAYRQQRKYVLDNLRYGTANFRCDATTGGFYRIFITPILVVVALAVGLPLLLAGLKEAGGPTALFMFLPLLFIGLAVAFQLLLFPYLTVRTANLVWNNTHLDSHGFASTLSLWSYFKLVAANLVLTVLTLGLFWPWAKVRVARYRASRFAMLAAAPLDGFVAGETVKASALGDEASEVFDVDISF